MTRRDLATLSVAALLLAASSTIALRKLGPTDPATGNAPSAPVAAPREARWVAPEPGTRRFNGRTIRVVPLGGLATR